MTPYRPGSLLPVPLNSAISLSDFKRRFGDIEGIDRVNRVFVVHGQARVATDTAEYMISSDGVLHTVGHNDAVLPTRQFGMRGFEAALVDRQGELAAFAAAALKNAVPAVQAPTRAPEPVWA